MGDASPITARQAGTDRINPGATPLRLEAAVLDWAGTVVDFGSFAPTQIFVEAFAEFGVAITLDEARGPMGLGKWDHIRTLCNDGAIAARFSALVASSALVFTARSSDERSFFSNSTAIA